ncbi:MAG: ADP-dependent glucokinase/phosphofructokinase, partial [Candidatus Thorarchaeota archaeon]
DDTLIYPKTLEEKITNIFNFLRTMKETTPEIVIQLEQSSTKNIAVLEKLVQLSIKEKIWDSLSCNEREIAELLEIINEKELAQKIRETTDQNSILKGCLKIFQAFSLKRLHLHQYGCYIIVASKDTILTNAEIRDSLCYASVITSLKASGFETIDDLTKIDYLNSKLRNFNLSPQYLELKNILQNDALNNSFLGIYEKNDIRIIVIPTILISKPLVTVGLGDTISSSTFIAELALIKDKKEKKKIS